LTLAPANPLPTLDCCCCCTARRGALLTKAPPGPLPALRRAAAHAHSPDQKEPARVCLTTLHRHARCRCGLGRHISSSSIRRCGRLPCAAHSPAAAAAPHPPLPQPPCTRTTITAHALAPDTPRHRVTPVWGWGAVTLGPERLLAGALGVLLKGEGMLCCVGDAVEQLCFAAGACPLAGGVQQQPC
jgi:hypothetical protein